MKKCIWVEFPDDFTPPEKFDVVEEVGATARCEKCPFYVHDSYDPYEDCVLSDKAYRHCPLIEYFK